MFGACFFGGEALHAPFRASLRVDLRWMNGACCESKGLRAPSSQMQHPLPTRGIKSKLEQAQNGHHRTKLSASTWTWVKGVPFCLMGNLFGGIEVFFGGGDAAECQLQGSGSPQPSAACYL